MNQEAIIEKAKAVAGWMKEYHWYEAKRYPDPLAAELGGFDKLLLDLCDAVEYSKASKKMIERDLFW